MTEFPRLLQTGSLGQRAMLTVAKDDAPSAFAQKRLLSALGLGGATMAVSSLAQASSHVGASSEVDLLTSLPGPAKSGVGETATSTAVPSQVVPAAGSLMAPGAKVATTVVAKWLVFATLSIAVVSSSVVWLRHSGRAEVTVGPVVAGLRGSRTEATPKRAVSTQTTTDIASPPVAARAEATLPLPPPNKDSERGATELRAASNLASSRHGADRPVSPERLTVREEVILVEKARAALRQGDPASSLALLEIRRKGVRGGVLAPEAAVLRIEALRALGQRARATQEAVKFFREHPDSPLLERLRDLLEASEP